MHEVFAAKKILDEAAKQGAVKKIVVEAGDLAEITAEDLEQCLKELAKCEVCVEKKKATVQCKCGYCGEPKITLREHDAVLFECPKCKKLPRIVEGDEIVLKEVEV